MSDFKTGALMYALAGGVILFVIVQSLFFIVKSWKRAKEIGVEPEKLKQTVVTSVLFTIAPAVSILATVLALASALGIVLPWIRLSVIGNLAYETVAANNALDALGGTLSEEVTDTQQFSTVMWTMTIGSCFPLILLPIFCKKIHKVMGNAVKKNEKTSALGEILGAAGMIGIVAAFVAKSLAAAPDAPDISAGLMSVSVLVSAMVFTIALDWLARKKGIKKLEPFVLPLAMFGAMGIAVLFTQILPPDIAGFTFR